MRLIKEELINHQQKLSFHAERYLHAVMRDKFDAPAKAQQNIIAVLAIEQIASIIKINVKNPTCKNL